MATPTAPRIFACIRSAASQSSHSSRQCLRSISTTRAYRQNNKRQLMTESAYRPTSLDPPPPPPRNASVPNTSIAGGASHNLESSSAQQKLSWTGSTLSSPRIQEDTPAVDISESEAQISKPVTAATPSQSNSTQSPTAAATKSTPTPTRPRRTFRPQKAAMTLTPTAIDRLRDLLDQPNPKLIRVGVKNKGCSGSAYHLEYVESPGRFDEVVEQDGVKVLIDSKALIKVIGSEMDWVEDKLSQRFTFRNPNVTEQCGCGESFSVG